MASKPLADYKTAPDVPVLIWENPLERTDDDFLLTQVSTGETARTAEPQVFELRKTPEGKAFPSGITVGRMTNNDLMLDARSVSRFHAYFVKQPTGDWHLVDAQSKLGTWVDVQKVDKGKPLVLRPRSRIRFGNVSLVFLIPSAFTEYLAAKRQAR